MHEQVEQVDHDEALEDVRDDEEQCRYEKLFSL
jgi:hypothetical protein